MHFIHLRLTLLLAVALLVLCGCQPPPDLAWRELVEPVPEVSLARREPGDAKRLGELRQRIERTLAEPGLSAQAAASAYSELGRQYMAHEFKRAATVSLRNVLAIDPDWRTAHYLLATLLQRESELEAARRHLLESLRLAPGDGNTLLRLGEVALSSGQIDQAGDYFRQAQRDSRTEISARAGLGRAAYLAGDYASAASELQAVLKQQPQASSLRHPLAQSLRALGDLRGAKSQLELAGTEQIKQADPLVDALSVLIVGSRSLLARAYRAKIDGDLETAERYYRLAIDADPNFALAVAGLGQFLAELGRNSEALESYQRAVVLDPEFPEAWFKVGTLLLKLDEPDDADAAFLRVLAIDPQHHDARFRHAAILHQRGQLADSKHQLEQVLAQAPGHVEALKSLVMLLVAEGQIVPAEARLQQGLALNLEAADRSSLLLLHAQMANLRGDSVAALAAYQSAVKADEQNHEAWFNLAVSQVVAGLDTDAAGSFAEVVALQPGNARAVLGLARAQMRTGQWSAARQTLERGYSVHGNDLDIADALIELLAACPDDAIRDGPRAVQMAEQLTRSTLNLRFMELTAMALAEVGEFEQALKLVQKLIDTGEQHSAPADVGARLRAAQAAYLAGKPNRLPAGRP